MTMITAFTPLMYPQVAPQTIIEDYTFQSGIHISAKTVPEVFDGMKTLKAEHGAWWVATSEVQTLRDARGWMWVRTEVPSVGGHQFRDNISRQIIGPMTDTLRNIHLAGAGETNYWAFGPLSRLPKIYLSSTRPHSNIPYRITNLYTAPILNRRVASWSVETLTIAEQIDSDLANYKGSVIPRLALAFHSFTTLSAINSSTVSGRNSRLQMAVSALETFYIAPIAVSYTHLTLPTNREV